MVVIRVVRIAKGMSESFSANDSTGRIIFNSCGSLHLGQALNQILVSTKKMVE